MEATTPENCEACLRTPLEPGSTQHTQWISVCRCDRPYSPSSQFSIDICAKCRLRVPLNGAKKVSNIDVCSCAQPQATKVPTYIKQNEKDPLTLDLDSLGIPLDNFPAERFVPISVLGEGARAKVFLCRDRQRGTKVALKCFKKIPPSLKNTFEGDARKNKLLTHTNIAKVTDFGFHNGVTPYLVTEYKDGFNLEQYLALYGPPTHDIAVKILIGICEALLYAQKESVLHRDIRTRNVIFLDDMNSEPSVSITDFALPKVKATEELTDPRDAFYMSAEEGRNMDFTEKSEVYSIGCVGFALLTGRPPFQDGTALDIKNSHALKLPPRISSLAFDPKRPGDLEEVIERCLEKDASKRFDTVAKLLERLQVFPHREQLQIAAVEAAKKKAKMMRMAKIGGAVVAVLAVFAIGFAVFGPH